MAKFAFSYHGGSEPATDEEREQVMAAWMGWFGGLGDAVVDHGNPFGPPKTVNADGSVTDGGGPNPVSGYSIVEAADIDAAVTMAKGCPILGNGGSVEVAEAFPM